ncbi:protein C12orf4 homolog [Nilaparvata lugens]|uniref:protein C12orf4 homolog n=1 Tax=Nilaparvata lugens TaxID=108931 RepID=UPI00193E3CA0|nr:protein C12orf4 homolog [Nilaparvata lugens]
MRTETERFDCTSKTFEFKFPMLTRQDEYVLQIPVDIPYQGSALELAQRILSSFQLPAYVEKDLENALSKFIECETINYYDDEAEKAIEEASKPSYDIEDVIKACEKSYKENTVEFGDRCGTEDREVFAAVFHKLVHSPALETILQVEHAHAHDVATVTNERDVIVAALTARQSSEMSRAVDGLSQSCTTEDEINQLARVHLDQLNLEQAKWDSQLAGLKQSQRSHYRQWVMDRQTTATSPLSSPLGSLSSKTFLDNSDSTLDTAGPALQESFTIHLGSQMKQMHNIRVLSTDIMEFCRLKSGEPQPQRLQTALGLYSNDLCGIVLLTDVHLSGYTGQSKEFLEICESSTEFHFAPVDDQLEQVKATIKDGVAWRRKHMMQDSPQQFLNLTSTEQQSRRSSTKNLQTGDVYLTHHSNLAEVHVVFHMVVDDSVRSNDINSRHPAILGLRNILKTACSNDITTITLPLLLMHEMTEEMTVNWCTKRAELVFKCVKGFMIEMASWGGSDLKNLQFLVPKGISEDVFASLATMLPSIFRVSNPLVLKSMA